MCREDVHEFEVLKPACIFTRVHAARYQQLHDDLKKSEPFQPLFLGDYSPVDSKKRYDFKKEIVVPVKCVLYTYSGAREDYAFIWRIPETMSETDLLQKNASVQRQIEGDLPVYHSRCMRREFIRSFETVTHAKPAVLREAYRLLTEDSSSSATAAQEEVDKRVAQLLDSKPSRVLHLCQRYIESTLETAVDERRHGDVDEGGDVLTHLAAALSVRDLYDQVSARCPPGTPIPSVQWLQYQFWLQKPMARTAGLYKGQPLTQVYGPVTPVSRLTS